MWSVPPWREPKAKTNQQTNKQETQVLYLILHYAILANSVNCIKILLSVSNESMDTSTASLASTIGSGKTREIGHGLKLMKVLNKPKYHCHHTSVYCLSSLNIQWHSHVYLSPLDTPRFNITCIWSTFTLNQRKLEPIKRVGVRGLLTVPDLWRQSGSAVQWARVYLSIRAEIHQSQSPHRTSEPVREQPELAP
jgi:hypothetical protein